MIVGKANKQADDYGADPVIFFGGEEGYRGSVEDYTLAKVASYKAKKGEDRLEALRLAINKQAGRFDSEIVLNHQLMGVLLNMAKGDKTARVVTRFLTPGNDGKHYVRLTMEPNAQGCSVVHNHKKGVNILKVCKESVEIPVEGALEIISNNPAGTAMRGTITPRYSFVNDMAHMAVVNPDGVFEYELPLYSLKDVDKIIDKKLPTLTLVMVLQLKQASRVFLKGISYKIKAEADVHDVKFSTRFRPEDDPVFDRSSVAEKQGKGVSYASTTVIDDSIYGKINDHITRLAKLSQGCNCEASVKCTCNPGKMSWSMSRGEEILYSKNPTERWEFAHAGEQLVALQVLRLAVQNRGDRTIEQALADPMITVLLLKEAGRNRLVEALEVVMGGLENIPSVLALCTHSTGLPHEGCYDVECGPSILDAILPGRVSCASIDATDVEALLVHSLTCRSYMVCEPNSKVRPSLMGYSVLACCLPGDPAVHVKNLAKELGMVGTSLKNAVVGALTLPGDILYRTSRMLESTTSDMCRFLMGCERTRMEPAAHSCMRIAFTPKYLIKDHGRTGLQAVTFGGWQTMTLRIKSASAKKRSHIVMYRIGDRAERACTVIFYVPGMHIGFSCAMGTSFAKAFGRHSHARMSYGKLRTNKVYLMKHFVKTVLGLLPESCVNSDAELAFSVTPHYPKASSSYKANADKLPHTPGKDATQWQSVMFTSEPFKGDGYLFYPIVPVMDKLLGAVDRVLDLGKDVISAVSPIRVHSKEGRLYLYDASLNADLELRFDPNIHHSVGMACASKHSLTKGAFRVMSHQFEGEFGSVLSLHPFTDENKDVICLYYRGCTYVSEPYIKGLHDRISSKVNETAKESINQSRQKTAAAMRPWLVVSKQEPIGIGVGGALAAGALGGLAASALVSPALYRPRPYYYGPPYYPAPYYPYPY